MLALARHRKARLLQGGDHTGPVLRHAALDALHQVGLDHVTGVGRALDPGPQLRRLEVGAMSRLLHPRPRRIVRPAPGVLEVAGFHQRAICLLPAGRRDVQALARLQVTPRRDHMHVNAAPRLAVPHRRPGVAIRRQTGPGRVLELVEHPVDLRVARLVLRGPGDHGRRVLLLELERVGHRRYLVRIAAQHRHLGPLVALAVRLAREVGRRRGRRPRPARSRSSRTWSPSSVRWRGLACEARAMLIKPSTSLRGCDDWSNRASNRSSPTLKPTTPRNLARQSRRPRPTMPWNQTRGNRPSRVGSPDSSTVAGAPCSRASELPNSPTATSCAERRSSSPTEGATPGPRPSSKVVSRSETEIVVTNTGRPRS